MKKILMMVPMVLVLFILVNANADTLYLNVNNINISNGPWGEVKLTQNGQYEVDFSVDAYQSILIPGENFGIQKFGFNKNTLAALSVAAPTGWSASLNKNMDGFGTFNLVESGTGQYRKDPLVFSVTSTGSNPIPISVSDFIVSNTAGYIFAAHIAGFTVQRSTEDSGYFSTSNASTSVPEPGILILLGIAMSAIGAASWRITKI